MFGEYARTNKEDIFIYANVVDEKGNKLDYIMKLVNGGPIKYYLNKDEKIVKHSKNIIDLIEVGDIVNNGYVYEIGNTEDGHKWVHNLNGLLLFNNDIKTILTKEQYTRNCYTVQ